MVSEAFKINIDKLLKNPKIKKLMQRLGVKKSQSQEGALRILNYFARNPAALAAFKKVALESISEAKKKVDIANLSVGNTYKDSKGYPVKIVDISGSGSSWKITYQDGHGKKKIVRTSLDKGINLYEGNLPSNIQKWIRDRGPKPSKDVKMIGKWVKKLTGHEISGGVAIGKNYNTLVLDIEHQDAAIHYDTTSGEIKLYKKKIRSFNDFKKVFQAANESINEISTLGVSGLKSFAKKHKYSVRSKKSGGRVPLMYLSKDGKQFGPFDPTITTKKYLLKKLGLNESVNEATDVNWSAEMMWKWVSKALKTAGIKEVKYVPMKSGWLGGKFVWGGFYTVQAEKRKDVLPFTVDKKGNVHLNVSPKKFIIGKIGKLPQVVKNLKDFKKSDLDVYESVNERTDRFNNVHAETKKELKAAVSKAMKEIAKGKNPRFDIINGRTGEMFGWVEGQEYHWQPGAIADALRELK
jgi:hypothetical protein